MTVFKSKVDPASDSFRKNREEMLELVAEMREVESRAVERSNSRADRFHERGQLLPRERIAHLLDPGAPVLEIQNIAGFDPAQEGSLPGGGRGRPPHRTEARSACSAAASPATCTIRPHRAIGAR